MIKPGFHVIVTIVAIAENGCDDPDDHMEIFFLVRIVMIRIATVVQIETGSISMIVVIK